MKLIVIISLVLFSCASFNDKENCRNKIYSSVLKNIKTSTKTRKLMELYNDTNLNLYIFDSTYVLDLSFMARAIYELESLSNSDTKPEVSISNIEKKLKNSGFTNRNVNYRTLPSIVKKKSISYEHSNYLIYVNDINFNNNYYVLCWLLPIHWGFPRKESGLPYLPHNKKFVNFFFKFDNNCNLICTQDTILLLR